MDCLDPLPNDAIGFAVLFEEGPCLVVSKPPGLLTQSPPGIDSLEVRVKSYLARRGSSGGSVYLGVPHRLDRPASGALLLATSRAAARRLSAQFERRRVRKVYWVLVSGCVEPDRGDWEDWIRKVPGEPRAEIVPPGHPEGRPALLHYQVLARAEWGTWLEIVLETGRTHQIRLQAASRGHAVLGDAQYGSAVPFGPQYDDWRLRAVALHARSVRFDHPASRREVFVEAPLSDPWAEYVGKHL